MFYSQTQFKSHLILPAHPRIDLSQEESCQLDIKSREGERTDRLGDAPQHHPRVEMGRGDQERADIPGGVSGLGKVSLHAA